MDDMVKVACIITACREDGRSSSYTAERILVALGLRTEPRTLDQINALHVAAGIDPIQTDPLISTGTSSKPTV